MFADYTFYITEYKGSDIPEAIFTEVERDAGAFLSYLTRDRINTDNLPDTVKHKVRMATCAVADICYRQRKDEDSSAVSSESVGNHSKSYAVVRIDYAQRQKQKGDAARMYLRGTGLMYGGLR